jgi:hypothetical protein
MNSSMPRPAAVAAALAAVVLGSCGSGIGPHR